MNHDANVTVESNPAPPRPLTLIVEDQDVMRAMLREFVQNAFPGCAILDAGTGARAVELSVEHKPQLGATGPHPQSRLKKPPRHVAPSRFSEVT